MKREASAGGRHRQSHADHGRPSPQARECSARTRQAQGASCSLLTRSRDWHVGGVLSRRGPFLRQDATTSGQHGTHGLAGEALLGAPGTTGDGNAGPAPSKARHQAQIILTGWDTHF